MAGRAGRLAISQRARGLCPSPGARAPFGARERCVRLLALTLLALLSGVRAALAGPILCGLPPEPDASAQRRFLHISAAVRAALERHPQAAVALVARDGTDLSRWGLRHSHAGLALRAHPRGPWTVRQLYYDCESGAPRVFDQGLAGFAHGSRLPDRGFLSLTLLPGEAALALESAALDDAAALGLLHQRYSANAYAFSERYQNCNQWLAELMALAWGGARTRGAAQAWLREAGYEAQVVDVGWLGWLWLSRLSPWLHLDDHPEEDRARARLRISLPQALHDWLVRRHDTAVHLQVCWQGERLVLRHDARPLPADCAVDAGDEVVALPP